MHCWFAAGEVSIRSETAAGPGRKAKEGNRAYGRDPETGTGKDTWGEHDFSERFTQPSHLPVVGICI